MGRFKSNLNIKFKENRDMVYILIEPLIYDSDSFGRVFIPEGFQTDFASVPRVPIVYAVFGNRAHREAVLHDYLFRKNCIPKVSFMRANGLFLEAMKSRNKPFYIRYPMYGAVVVGSKSCFHKRKVMDPL